jgi:hypothetical protein
LGHGDGMTIEHYLTNMANESTWGDGLMLAAACRCYSRPIHVLCAGKDTLVIDGIDEGQEDKSSIANPIYLGYLPFGVKDVSSGQPDHYVSLTPSTPIVTTTSK